MPGVAGRSGRRRKPIETHLLAGTYRRDRHGPLPEQRGNLALLPVKSDPDERDVRRLIAGLSRPQQALARRLLIEYEGWSPTDTMLLRLTLEALDRREECRQRIAADGIVLTGKRGGARPHHLLRAERQAAAFVAAVFRQLNLGGAK